MKYGNKIGSGGMIYVSILTASYTHIPTFIFIKIRKVGYKNQLYNSPALAN
jgi:hypothetical protein